MPGPQSKRKSQQQVGRVGQPAGLSLAEALKRVSNERPNPRAVASSSAVPTAPLRPRRARQQIYVPTSGFGFPSVMYPFGSILVPMSRPASLRKALVKSKRARTTTVRKLASSSRTSSRADSNSATPKVKREVEEVEDEERGNCFFYTKYGTCLRGDACFYLHDPACVAICDAFVKGRCQTNLCRLRHETEMSRLPICEHFLRGSCLASRCPYPHGVYPPTAQICRKFQRGECDLEQDCNQIHSYVCADFYESKGAGCPNQARCPFQHPAELILIVDGHVEAQLAQPRPNQTPCFYMLTRGQCKRGNACFFSHTLPKPNSTNQTIIKSETMEITEEFEVSEVSLHASQTSALNYDSETSREGRDADVSDMDSDNKFTPESRVSFPKDQRLPLRTRKTRK